MVKSGESKLNREDGHDELYNLESDLGEQYDLYGAVAATPIEELSVDLRKRLARLVTGLQKSLIATSTCEANLHDKECYHDRIYRHFSSVSCFFEKMPSQEAFIGIVFLSRLPDFRAKHKNCPQNCNRGESKNGHKERRAA